MPSYTATTQLEGRDSWPPSTPSTAKRWSVPTFTRVRLTFCFFVFLMERNVWNNHISMICIRQMARFWLCGSVWSVSVWTPLSSNGSTRLMSTSPTGSQTSRSSPLRKPAVCSTLERCVWVCVGVCAIPPFAPSRFVLECVTSGFVSITHVSICRHTAGRSVTAHRSCLLCARGKERLMNPHSLGVPPWVVP